MLNWFKRNSLEKLILRKWKIEELPGFEKISNADSIQYSNYDGSRTIYFSIVTIGGNQLFTNITYTGEPSVMVDASGWKLKGTRKLKDQILVCLISGVNPDDIGWAKTYFDSIQPR